MPLSHHCAEILKLNGYSTAQIGKCHEVPVWQVTPVGPFDAWPSGGGGFEYFYGFIGGETNQYYPALFEGTTPVESPKTPEEGCRLTADLATKAAIDVDKDAENVDHFIEPEDRRDGVAVITAR